mmetsp:Transcript_5161/g.9252  ORF Transcript_5161/g.9252 Transcript_5161/m.9252 type:complete len:95 (-) Transcript_5161:342-626(-)
MLPFWASGLARHFGWIAHPLGGVAKLDPKGSAEQYTEHESRKLKPRYITKNEVKQMLLEKCASAVRVRGPPLRQQNVGKLPGRRKGLSPCAAWS